MESSITKMFELYGFSKEDHLRAAYHENCDYSQYCDEDLKKKIETDVQNWLDNNNAESPQLQMNLKPGDKWLLFERSEVAMKTASNNWMIYHVANSSFWPRLISSKPKLLVQHPGELITIKNEVRSFNYGEAERHMSQISEGLLKNSSEPESVPADRSEAANDTQKSS